MKKIGLILTSFIALILGLMVNGNSLAKELYIGFPASLPPWTIETQNSGITVEVVRESLQNQGHTLKTKYIPLSRLNRTIGEKLDAHAQVESLNLEDYYSEKVMVFQTSIITLEKSRLKFTSIDHLNDKSLVAFQNASFLFGDTFAAMTKSNPRYKEIFKQENQVGLLFKGRAEVILSDKSIFSYYRRITSLVDTSPPVVFHHIKGLTEPSPAFVVFKNKNLRDAFNVGLKQLRDTGRYKEIFRKYVR